MKKTTPQASQRRNNTEHIRFLLARIKEIDGRLEALHAEIKRLRARLERDEA